MSKVVKGIKKGVKKIGKVIKKVAPYVAIAVAAYFTAGVAMSYFGPTQAFAAAMPGFKATAAGSAGIFTKAATAIGLQGPASAVAAASSSVPAALMTNSAYVAAGSPAIGAGSTSLAPLGGKIAGNTVGQAVGKTALEEGTRRAGMGIAEKLLVSKMIVDTAGGLLSKEPRGPYDVPRGVMGFDKDGEGPGMGDSERSVPGMRDHLTTPEEFYARGTPDFMPTEAPARQQGPQQFMPAETPARQRTPYDNPYGENAGGT